MKTFQMSESVLKNLLIFLDRVEIKGFKELTAMNEILAILNQSVQEEVPK